MIYQFAIGSRLSGDPQLVGDTLAGILKDHGGRMAAQHVVLAATPKRSALHRYFEWDDTAAALEYRLVQARYVIRSVVMSETTDGKPVDYVRAIVAVAQEGGEDSFMLTVDAMRNEGTRAEVVARAKAELAAWRRRYQHLKTFAAVFAAIDNVLE